MTTSRSEDDPHTVIAEYQSWADAIREERLARAARARVIHLPWKIAPLIPEEPFSDPYGLDVRVRAEFNATTIVAHRTGIGRTTTYTFTAVDADGNAHTLQTREIGVVAAGDDLRGPSIDREELYHVVGAQARAHLVGLVDAVAGHRINLVRQEHLRHTPTTETRSRARDL